MRRCASEFSLAEVVPLVALLVAVFVAGVVAVVVVVAVAFVVARVFRMLSTSRRIWGAPRLSGFYRDGDPAREKMSIAANREVVHCCANRTAGSVLDQRRRNCLRRCGEGMLHGPILASAEASGARLPRVGKALVLVSAWRQDMCNSYRPAA